MGDSVMKKVDLSGMDGTEICEILHDRCEFHDWTYMMSDDSRAYHAGLAEADEIEYIRSVLDAMGFQLTAKVIIEGWKPNSLKKEGYLV
jgi:hypothetical protein